MREGRRARRRDGAAGQRDAHRAGRGVDPLAERLAGGRDRRRFSAAAPTIFSTITRGGDAAPALAVQRAFDRDVVIGEHGLDAAAAHLRRHLEIHHVARVILDDEQHARAAVDGLRRRPASGPASAR